MDNKKLRKKIALLQRILEWLEYESAHYDCPDCGHPGCAFIGEILTHTRKHNANIKARARKILKECPDILDSLGMEENND